jgi:hypothetical protein
MSLIQGKKVGCDLLACLKILMQRGQNVKGIQGELPIGFTAARKGRCRGRRCKADSREPILSL